MTRSLNLRTDNEMIEQVNSQRLLGIIIEYRDPPIVLLTRETTI